jgi:hypothetical protein
MKNTVFRYHTENKVGKYSKLPKIDEFNSKGMAISLFLIKSESWGN